MAQPGEHDTAHHQDMPRWGRELWDRVWHQAAQYDHLSARTSTLETRMADQQAEIDTDVAAIGSAVTNIQAEIAALQAAQPQLNLAALDAAVAQLASVAPAPAPVDPTPTPDPNPAPPAA